MPQLPTFRLLVALSALAVTFPAFSQSYRHAPGGSHDALPLPDLDPARIFGLGAVPSSPRASRPAPERLSALPAAPLPTEGVVPASFSPEPGARPIPPASAVDRWVPVNQPDRPAHAAFAPPQPIAPASAQVDAPVAAPSPLPVPPTAVAARALAAARLAAGDPIQAEQLLAAAAERFADDTDLVVTLARLRESQGDWTGAIDAYGTVLELRPEDARWRLRRADCLYYAESFELAVADYLAASAADPAAFSIDEYARFGDAALQAGDPATAEAAFTALSRISEKPIARVELLRGLAALKQGHADRARQILLRAGALWPRDAALTEALRIAAAQHYGDAPTVTASAESTPAEVLPSEPILPASAEASPEERPAAGWRPTSSPSSIGWRVRRTPVEFAEALTEGTTALVP